MSIGSRRLLVVAGAPKSGTTSLTNWLNQLDEFRLLEGKEPGFFRERAGPFWMDSKRKYSQTLKICDTEEYLRLFQGIEPGQWAIDGSTDYFHDNSACEKLKDWSKYWEIKIIVILRDPLDRSYSEYLHTVNSRFEHKNYLDSLHLEEKRRFQNYQPMFFHKRRSTYFSDIEKYRDAFGENFFILPFSTMKKPQLAVDSVCDFLGIAHSPLGDMSKLNVTSKVRLSRAPSFTKEIPVFDRMRQTAAWKLASSVVHNSFAAHHKLVHRRSKRADRYLFSALRDDILACVGDPHIPTDDWASVHNLLAKFET